MVEISFVERNRVACLIDYFGIEALEKNVTSWEIDIVIKSVLNRPMAEYKFR
jgi:hypothetical protein